MPRGHVIIIGMHSIELAIELFLGYGMLYEIKFEIDESLCHEGTKLLQDRC